MSVRIMANNLSPARDKLDAIGIEAICERIKAGETQNEIAKSIGVSTGSLSMWMDNDQNLEQSARARAASAEAWLDRGLECIASALAKDGGIDASAAKAYAQECARRAAIRNPKYRDKVDVDAKHSGSVVLQITPLDEQI